MSVYKNIDGTSKKSFRIGAKGLVLSTGTVEATAPNQEKLKQLLVDGKAVVTEDSFLIPRELVSKFKLSSDESECEFEYKYYDYSSETWKVQTVKLKTTPQLPDGIVQGTTDSKDGNIAVFDGNSGKKIKDADYRILSDIFNSSDDSKEIPTFKAVKDYVGEVEKPLRMRATGETALILG